MPSHCLHQLCIEEYRARAIFKENQSGPYARLPHSLNSQQPNNFRGTPSVSAGYPMHRSFSPTPSASRTRAYSNIVEALATRTKRLPQRHLLMLSPLTAQRLHHLPVVQCSISLRHPAVSSVRSQSLSPAIGSAIPSRIEPSVALHFARSMPKRGVYSCSRPSCNSRQALTRAAPTY